ncbi:hypothetical protein G6F35_018825 [Rhizopus arrhizus]|nr:hypothetical protein G6F35_018825 [Rhizopus arrhizus]KAG1369149.1 hypothetical protein G6F60_015695 [Rhizopus arrhizus]
MPPSNASTARCGCARPRGPAAASASACRWPHARTPHEPSPLHPGPAGRRRRAVPAHPAAQPGPQGA